MDTVRDDSHWGAYNARQQARADYQGQQPRPQGAAPKWKELIHTSLNEKKVKRATRRDRPPK